MKNIWLDMNWNKRELPVGTRVNVRKGVAQWYFGLKTGAVVGYTMALPSILFRPLPPSQWKEIYAVITVKLDDGSRNQFMLGQLERE